MTNTTEPKGHWTGEGPLSEVSPIQLKEKEPLPMPKEREAQLTPGTKVWVTATGLVNLAQRLSPLGMSITPGGRQWFLNNPHEINSVEQDDNGALVYNVKCAPRGSHDLGLCFAFTRSDLIPV